MASGRAAGGQFLDAASGETPLLQMNADAFIEFIKRLLVGGKRKIFLIVDGEPAHRAKKTKTFVESLRIDCDCFFFLLFAGQESGRVGMEARESRHRGAHGGYQQGRSCTKSEIVIAFAAKVPSKIRAFFQKETLRYAA